MKRKLLYFGIFLLLALGWFLYQLFGPNSKVRLGPKTTYITEPLAEDGLPNYVLALDQLQREGVTPENNGALPFWRAMGPGEEMTLADFKLLCDALGLEEVDTNAFLSVPEEDDTLLEELGSELSQHRESKHWKVDEQGQRVFRTQVAAFEFLELARCFPWTNKDSSRMAVWVEGHQAAFDALVEAANRPIFYSPSLTVLRNPEEECLAVLLTYAQVSRYAAGALRLRCQFYVGKGDLGAAWSNLFAALQLGQHVAHGTTLVEQLVALAIQRHSLESLPTLLEHDDLKPKLALQILEDLDALEARVDMASALDTGERFMFLDSALRLTTGRLGGSRAIKEGIEQLGMKAAFDTNRILEIGNRWYDKLVHAACLEYFQERQVALDKIDLDLQDLQASMKSRLAGAIFSRGRRTQLLSDILLNLMLPAIHAAVNAEDRGQTQLELAQVATALAIYKLQHGQYPETLDALSPEILEKVPEDLFAAAPLTYRRTEDGYLLYSVGENEIDDNGTNTRWLGDNEPFRIYRGEWLSRQQWRKTEADPRELNDEGDDLIIRMPMPKYEWPKAP